MSGAAWSDSAKYTVAVDFDGVIHSYTTKWINAQTIPDPPVPGAIEWLNEIRKTFDVVIFTTRAKEYIGANAVYLYLAKNGFDPEGCAITPIKPAALVYIDDRGYRFEGDNFPTVEQIHNLRPWNKRPMGHR